MKSPKTIVAAALCGIFLIGVGVTFAIKNNNTTDITNPESIFTGDNREIQNIKNEITALENILKERYMLLVNKDETNRLSSTYVPDDLITTTDLPFQSYIETRDLDKTVAAAAKKMFDAAAAEGINLLGASGYRSYQVQENMYIPKVAEVGKEEAEKYLAPPGASEHQTGYALDILSSDYGSMDDGFENTEAFKWLMANAQDYGFILRYPQDKVEITKYQYEPWHYRYVGVEHSKVIIKNNFTLEEYIDAINNKIIELEAELQKS